LGFFHQGFPGCIDELKSVAKELPVIRIDVPQANSPP
jgi:hypothetical protein